MKIERIAIIAKFVDGTVRQVLTTDEQENMILDAMVQMDKDKRLKVIEEPIQGIDLVIYSETKSNIS